MEKGGVPAAHESIEAFPNSIDPESFILIETLHGHQPIALDALTLLLQYRQNLFFTLLIPTDLRPLQINLTKINL